MPSYEVFFIAKRMTKNETVACLKRTGELILKENGVLRKIENLGTRNLPFKIRTPIPGHKRYAAGNFFLYHCDLSPPAVGRVMDHLKTDTDLMKVKCSEKIQEIPDDYVCTLDEEMKPPALRPSIQSLVKQNEERIKRSYKRISVD